MSAWDMRIREFYACKRCGAEISGDHELCGGCVEYEASALKVATAGKIVAGCLILAFGVIAGALMAQMVGV